jgi:hypothetical protein
MSGSLDDLKMDNLLKFSSDFWAKLAVAIRAWIYQDMQDGKLQGKQDSYRSAQYVKYKQNYMERLSNRGGKQGTKLKAYAGRSIRSNEIGSVNMLLTGDLINGLQRKSSTPTELTMTYADKDEGKIVGNERFGRDVRNLTNDNCTKVANKMRAELTQNILNWEREKIIITIGK